MPAGANRLTSTWRSSVVDCPMPSVMITRSDCRPTSASVGLTKHEYGADVSVQTTRSPSTNSTFATPASAVGATVTSRPACGIELSDEGSEPVGGAGGSTGGGPGQPVTSKDASAEAVCPAESKASAVTARSMHSASAGTV